MSKYDFQVINKNTQSKIPIQILAVYNFVIDKIQKGIKKNNINIMTNLTIINQLKKTYLNLKRNKINLKLNLI